MLADLRALATEATAEPAFSMKHLLSVREAEAVIAKRATRKIAFICLFFMCFLCIF